MNIRKLAIGRSAAVIVKPHPSQVRDTGSPLKSLTSGRSSLSPSPHSAAQGAIFLHRCFSRHRLQAYTTEEAIRLQQGLQPEIPQLFLYSSSLCFCWIGFDGWREVRLSCDNPQAISARLLNSSFGNLRELRAKDVAKAKDRTVGRQMFAGTLAVPELQGATVTVEDQERFCPEQLLDEPCYASRLRQHLGQPLSVGLPKQITSAFVRCEVGRRTRDYSGERKPSCIGTDDNFGSLPVESKQPNRHKQPFHGSGPTRGFAGAYGKGRTLVASGRQSSDEQFVQ